MHGLARLLRDSVSRVFHKEMSVASKYSFTVWLFFNLWPLGKRNNTASPFVVMEENSSDKSPTKNEAIFIKAHTSDMKARDGRQ